MSYRKLLTDRCDIYHLVESTSSPGYGLPGEPVYSYPKEPDLVNIPCYFTERQHQSITQGEPGAEITQSFLVHFLIGTDIRLNDKVFFNGVEYKAQVPKPIKKHHIEVTVVRQGSL